MTSLLNKRSFIPMFNKAAEVAMKYNQPLSVMMIDADNLKEVNDKYGHKAGDKLIISMANAIEDCLRTSDIICRYGGDEFVALLEKADQVLYECKRQGRNKVTSYAAVLAKGGVEHTSTRGYEVKPGRSRKTDKP